MLSFYAVLVFFFFKQKTAYEMRISDWSSDVCSSDLEALRRQERSQERAGGADEHGHEGGDGTDQHEAALRHRPAAELGCPGRDQHEDRDDDLQDRKSGV